MFRFNADEESLFQIKPCQTMFLSLLMHLHYINFLQITFKIFPYLFSKTLFLLQLLEDMGLKQIPAVSIPTEELNSNAHEAQSIVFNVHSSWLE